MLASGRFIDKTIFNAHPYSIFDLVSTLCIETQTVRTIATTGTCPPQAEVVESIHAIIIPDFSPSMLG